MTSTYSPVSQLVDEEWGLVRDDLLPPRSDVVSDLVNDTVDTNSCLENQVGMLKSMVEMQGKEIRNLKSRATLSNSQNSLVPSNSTASLLVDTTPILSEELCLEMSKIYIESRCGKGTAFLRLGELAEVYPLAAAFHFVAEFQYRDDKAWNEPFPIKSSVLYLRHVCSEKASKEYTHVVLYAQFLLGHCYFNGHGKTSRDKALGLKYMQLACAQGYAPALVFVGANAC